MKVGSANLLSGRSLADGLIDAGRLSAAAGLLDVDVLALQEVDRNQARSGQVDQAALVARVSGAVDGRYAASLEGTPGAGWTASTRFEPLPTDDEATAGPARFGIALLSRRPVERWEVLRLAPAQGRYPMPIPSRPARLLWLRDEPRVAIAAVLTDPPITIATTHLSFVPFVAVRQLTRVRRWLAELPGPSLLVGDLNLPAPIARRISQGTPLVCGPTFPSPRPRLQLDHALAARLPAGARWDGRVVALPISDHRALMVELSLPA